MYVGDTVALEDHPILVIHILVSAEVIEPLYVVYTRS